eukprot:9411278-Ditylum_brightwellii.AAC.1
MKNQEQIPYYSDNNSNISNECVVSSTTSLQQQSVASSLFLPPKPDVVSYNSVMDAWSKSGRIDGASRAESILRDMEKSWRR